MFKQLTAPDHVIAMSLSGKITGEDIKQYKGILEAKLGKHQHMGVCIDFTGLADMNADALVEGTKADFEFFTHIKQFARMAFVSDKEWPRAMISLGAPFLPTLEMKVFTPGERDAAIKWAAELPMAPVAKRLPAMRFIPTSRDDTLAFEINGVVSSAEMPAIIEKFHAFLDHRDKVRVLNRIRHFGGFDLSILMQSGLVSMKVEALQKVERYAVIGAPGWMRKVVETLNPLFPGLETRTFSADHEADAWAWLGAEPSE